MKGFIKVLWVLGFFSLSRLLTAEPSVQFIGSSLTPKLLELYTSQGCSSCPPAEKWISKLQDHPQLWKDIFPISFHVSYWDYLGWEDSLGSPVYRERQEKLAAENSMGSIYTPGFFLNGLEWREWRKSTEFSPGKFLKENRRGNESKGSFELSLKLMGDSLSANFKSLKKRETIHSDGLGENLILNVVILEFDKKTNIRNGENAGKNLTQDFVVSWFTSSRSKHGDWQISLKPNILNSNFKRALVAWVDSPLSLKPLQIAGGWL